MTPTKAIRQVNRPKHARHTRVRACRLRVVVLVLVHVHVVTGLAPERKSETAHPETAGASSPLLPSRMEGYTAAQPNGSQRGPGTQRQERSSQGQERGSASASEHGEEDWERVSIAGSTSEVGDFDIDATLLEDFAMVGIAEDGSVPASGGWDRISELETYSRPPSSASSCSSHTRQSSEASVSFAAMQCQGPFGRRPLRQQQKRHSRTQPKREWRTSPAGQPGATMAPASCPAGVV